MITQAPKGTKDLFGEEIILKNEVENKLKSICKNFGVNEIKTPIFEHTELFSRGVGETTDIVQKEMYTFSDNGGRSITLKPEGTAGVARSYIECNMNASAQPTKLFYIEPIFRCEKPQAGRYRQFYQFGVEFLGSYNPEFDAEVISLAYTVVKEFGLNDITLNINSLGGNVCRQKYNAVLKEFIESSLDNLCPTCRARYETNPLRILDCKNEICNQVKNNAPKAVDTLDPECRNHFEQVQNILTSLSIPFVINPYIVRGLDYYTKTVFEFISGSIGAQSTVIGGGRYDNLIKECGGPSVGAVGFGLGIERLIMAIKAQNENSQYVQSKDIFVGYIGDKGLIKSQQLVFELRQKGISAEGETLRRSVKAQLKYADKINAKYTVIIGDDEIESNKCGLKNMQTGEKIEVNIDDLCNILIPISVQ